jgi:hypothetical protein
VLAGLYADFLTEKLRGDGGVKSRGTLKEVLLLLGGGPRALGLIAGLGVVGTQEVREGGCALNLTGECMYVCGEERNCSRACARARDTVRIGRVREAGCRASHLSMWGVENAWPGERSVR